MPCFFSPPEKAKKGEKAAGKKVGPGKKKPASNLLTQDVQIKTMSTKLAGRSITKAGQRPLTKAEKAAKERARIEAEIEAAEAEAAAKLQQGGNTAANGEGGDNPNPEGEDPFDPRESARDLFFSLDVDRDGQLTEEEFVEGCMSDPGFLMMLETFSCDFLWGEFVKPK